MDYVHLILHTSKTQSYALLYTATASQLKIICEILHNLKSGVFPHTPKTKLLRKQNKTFLKLFAIPPPQSKRQSIVRKHIKTIYRMFIDLKTFLKQL